MICPHCPETILEMSDRQGIEIDYCPQCRGIWLDRGELDKLIQKNLDLSEDDEHQVKVEGPRRKISTTIYKHESIKDFEDHKRKSFFEELFK